MTIKRFSELKDLKSIELRYEYLKLPGQVGRSTFGSDRYLNQKFYKSNEWRQVRNYVISRDNGCDLGIPGFEIHDKILIHHMNPLQINDLIDGNLDIINPEFLISVSSMTHQAIHYGDKTLLPVVPVLRKPGDTRLW